MCAVAGHSTAAKIIAVAIVVCNFTQITIFITITISSTISCVIVRGWTVTEEVVNVIHGIYDLGTFEAMPQLVVR